MKAKTPNIFLLLITGFLLLSGILILASASASKSQQKFGNPYYFIKHQALVGLIPGLILMGVGAVIPLSFLKNKALLLIIFTLLLSGLVFFPPTQANFLGASRWLKLGPIIFQPSELLKVSFLIYVAAWLTSKKRKSKSMLIGFLGILVPLILLFMSQPDISTLGIIICSAAMIYFLSKTKLWHIALIGALGLMGFLILAQIAPYRLARLKVFLEPKLDPLGSGYQINQSLIAIGSGGLWGKGLGFSSQKLGFLPSSFADSIFAVIAEETGFIGAFILVLLFFILLIVGFQIANQAKTKFGKVLAQGISAWLVLQGLTNMGSMIGLLPLTGLPLPFLSYGGSHLISELIGVGILMNISKQ